MSGAWPRLDYAAWRDTAVTLQLWSQVVGKVRLALTPWLNHGWHVPLYVTAHGLGTTPIPTASGLLEIEFDFVAQRLLVRSSEGPDHGFALEPMSVATFYRRTLAELEAAGERVRIVARPNEVPDPIPFAEDETHRSYDAAAVHTFWRALIEIDRVFKRFRTGFLGKASPVHLWWGAFDLAVTRFSGRAAPLHPGGIPGMPDAITREAYSHEVSSAGFWPGSDTYPHAAFYAYAYPSPAGYEHARIEPAEATWVAALGEWILPYDAVRASLDPAATLLRFLETTYRAAADLAHWDPALECALGEPRKPRPVPPHR
jgi:hypothetical protein